MARQDFFLRNRLVGSVERPPINIHGQRTPAFGQAFFCPRCSELWLNAPVTGQISAVSTRLCEKHPSIASWNLSGSLWIDWEPAWNLALPQELLEYEFILQLTFKESTE